MNATAADIAKMGTILGIWAHPDDEVWTSGGLMQCAARNGQRVACVTATYGEEGETADENRWPKAQLAAVRRDELMRSLKILGVTEHYWLGYPDGGLQSVDDDEAVVRLAALIGQIRPDTILTFGSDGLTGHADHRQLYHWSLAARAVARSQARILCYTESDEKYDRAGKECGEWNIYFATDRPYTRPEAEMDVRYKLDAHTLAVKCQAYQAHASQTSHILRDPHGRKVIAIVMGCECFIEA